MTGITVKNIIEATGGELLCGSEDTVIKNIALDSRTMKGCDIFVPIIGEKTDGHLYIDKAFETGAVATFASEDVIIDGVHAYIKVDDTVDALQRFGAYLRDRLDMNIIGVTGSVGKTTTREMIALALSSGLMVTATKGNSNSQVGVPVTMSLLDEEADAAVVEMGISIPGEMPRLSKMVRPDIAVITNIGDSHIEFLGSKQGIFDEKLHITDGFDEKNILIVNGDDPILNSHAKNSKAKYKIKTYGMDDSNEYYPENITYYNTTTTFTAICQDEKIPVMLSVPGRHNVFNALSAIAVCDALGLNLEEAADKLRLFKGYKGRLDIVECGGITLIDDSYNASPDSMKAALEVLSNMDAGENGRRIAVLADMLELGPTEATLHKEIGEYIIDKNVDVLITVGTLAKNYIPDNRDGQEIFSYETADMALDKVVSYIREDDVILLKGSNGMKLGTIADRLKEKYS